MNNISLIFLIVVLVCYSGCLESFKLFSLFIFLILVPPNSITNTMLIKYVYGGARRKHEKQNKTRNSWNFSGAKAKLWLQKSLIIVSEFMSAGFATFLMLLLGQGDFKTRSYKHPSSIYVWFASFSDSLDRSYFIIWILHVCMAKRDCVSALSFHSLATHWWSQ